MEAARQLSIFATGGDIEGVRQAIADGVDVSFKDDSGSTPLHEAATRPDAEMVRMLLAAGADAASKDNRGSTPLHSAWIMSVEVVKMLLDLGPTRRRKTKATRPRCGVFRT
mmetsp:Transcript_30599/g.72715  ORF Transcript_30599/g.72715 Transcript_30599/m.72715 type:complete len:111 (+) Transcript_30599:74-406(+)